MILKRRQRRRHHNNNRNKHSYDGNNFLFSNNTDGHDKVHEKMQCPEGASDFQETSGMSFTNSLIHISFILGIIQNIS